MTARLQAGRAKGRGDHAISMTDGTRSQAWLFWLGLGLSLAMHVGVAAHLLSREPQDFGATDFTTTAISVELEATDILDAPEQSASTDAAPGSAGSPGEIVPVPEPEPEPEPQKAETLPPPQSEPEKVEAETPPPPDPEQLAAEQKATEEKAAEQLAAEQRAAEEKASEEAKIRDEEALRQAAVAEREKAIAEREKQEAEQRAREKERQLAEARARAEREAEAREEERERRAEKAKQAEREAKQKRTRMGANAGASGARGAKASAGRVSASQGALQNYKGIVNAWLARNKPPHGGGRGTVVVQIALSPSGSLISARVVSSSGNKALDQRALGDARSKSPFPKPPPGLTDAQRKFNFPYRFL